MSKCRNHDVALKARVALEALKGEKTAAELATTYGVHPAMIHQWKKALLEGATDISKVGSRRRPRSTRAPSGTCMRRSGSWPSLLIFVQKVQALDRKVRRGMIEPDHQNCRSACNAVCCRSRGRCSIGSRGARTI
jgi:transposase